MKGTRRVGVLGAIALVVVALWAHGAAHGDWKGAVDRLQLDPTAITGSRELPKVMNIVPWKAAEPPGGPDRPLNSLVQEVLSPLDRDEFRREITYYRDVTGQSAPVVAPGATTP
jgi:hypothetical protein